MFVVQGKSFGTLVNPRFVQGRSLTVHEEPRERGDMNPARCARDSRSVYGSSTKLGTICGSIGARTIAESPFDKPGERHKIDSCVNEINSRLCSLSKVNPLALW